jgi:predicted  nucleic acid-binding Zn-ribbon protein
MKLKEIRCSAEGYHSKATYNESVFVKLETYEKIKDDLANVEMWIDDLDGKHSDVEADIDIHDSSIDDVLKATQDDDYLNYEIKTIYDKYDIDFDVEYDEIRALAKELAEKHIIVNVVDNAYDDDEYDSETLEIDGNTELCVRDLCESPEDATLSRDIPSCTEIQRLMEQAYNWGKDGKEVHFTTSIDE